MPAPGCPHVPTPRPLAHAEDRATWQYRAGDTSRNPEVAFRGHARVRHLASATHLKPSCGRPGSDDQRAGSQPQDRLPSRSRRATLGARPEQRCRRTRRLERRPIRGLARTPSRQLRLQPGSPLSAVPPLDDRRPRPNAPTLGSSMAVTGRFLVEHGRPRSLTACDPGHVGGIATGLSSLTTRPGAAHPDWAATTP